jgi:hypothetical protein
MSLDPIDRKETAVSEWTGSEEMPPETEEVAHPPTDVDTDESETSNDDSWLD